MRFSLNLVSVLCAGPEKELCGECYSYHHQSEEYAGRATLACSQTHYGLPTGDASKNLNVHLTNLWVALGSVVLHLQYLYMPPFIVVRFVVLVYKNKPVDMRETGDHAGVSFRSEGAVRR